MYEKVIQELVFNKKRDIHLITPCCQKQNKDGKFVNYKGYSPQYGYCHSCGTTITPPPLYSDGKGNYYCWNTLTQKFEPLTIPPLHDVMRSNKILNKTPTSQPRTPSKPKLFVAFEVVTKTLNVNKENNLLQYLHLKYDSDKVNFVRQLYFLGTSKDGGTIFWFINKQGKAQKAKVSYYSEKGKRTDRFKVPYKNADGYYSCLYGEHLLSDNSKPIILVESEKTALVAAIEFPEYTWLAYSGINGLTDTKLEVLKNERIILIPDMSVNAVKVIRKKLPKMKTLNIEGIIYDMTFGENDRALKDSNWYNCDIEDVLRKSAH